MAFNGQTLSILVGGFDVQSLYGDGVNLYAAFGSNPIGNNDVLALPLAATVTSANTSDVTQLIPLVDAIPLVADRPGSKRSSVLDAETGEAIGCLSFRFVNDRFLDDTRVMKTAGTIVNPADGTETDGVIKASWRRSAG